MTWFGSIKPATHLRGIDKQKRNHKEVYYTLLGRPPHKQKHKHKNIKSLHSSYKDYAYCVIVSSENMLL